MTKRACCYCGSIEKELRPYGPEGAWLCFPCMKAEPSREIEAKKNFGVLLEAASQGGVPVIGGTKAEREEGPRILPVGKQSKGSRKT